LISRSHARWICLSVLLMSFGGLKAEAEIHLAVPSITTLLQADGEGIYQRMFARAMASLHYPVNQEFYPYKRALVQFRAGQADCVYSFTDVLTKELGADAVIASYPLGHFRYFLFSRADRPPVRSNEELEGLRLGAVIGHESYYGEVLRYPGEILEVNSDRQAMELLRQGRIDVAIAALPDIQPYLDELAYAEEFPLYIGYDRITCHNTPQNRVFLDDLSAELKKLKEEGGYRELAGDYFLDFNF